MEKKHTQTANYSQPQGPTPSRTEGFDGLGIHANIVRILGNLRFTIPTPIQHQVIPVCIEGKDIIGIAQTGTGKTLAFGIPMVQHLLELSGKPLEHNQGKLFGKVQGKQGLVILPTRELALQVGEVFQKLGRDFGLKTAILIGGTGMGLQMRNLRSNPHIIIATPGRLIDHITRKNLHLNRIAILVLDEADHMFDMGFAPQIQRILALLPKQRQTMLFSATMPPEILKIATTHMQLPLRFEIAPQGTMAEKVEHELFFVQREQRMSLLKKILSEQRGNVLLFLRTKHNAKKVCHNLLAANIPAAEIHSNRSLNQRKAALDGFKQGKYRVLVATDIASRGIDINGLTLVINYDLPESASDYVHRIGRTGRAGSAGKAISFAMPDQRNKVREIERLIRYAIPVSTASGLPAVATQPYSKKPIQNNYYSSHSRKFSKSFSSRSYRSHRSK